MAIELSVLHAQRRNIGTEEDQGVINSIISWNTTVGAANSNQPVFIPCITLLAVTEGI